MKLMAPVRPLSTGFIVRSLAMNFSRGSITAQAPHRMGSVPSSGLNTV